MNDDRLRATRAGWATMREVAARAGVSAMTVSRALQDPAKVAAEKRVRIDAAIAELGYIPDRLAGSLSSRASRLITALVSTFSGPVFEQTIDGLTDVLRGHGYQLLLGSTGYSPIDEQALVTALLGRRPDGLVLSGSAHTAEVRRLLARSRLPVVETWDLPAEPIDMVVGFSNYDAAAAMTRELLDTGYRRIAFLGAGSVEERPHDTRTHDRRRGYQRALEEAGRYEPIIVSTGAGTPSAAVSALALRQALAQQPRPDAIFCVSDMAAMGVVLECRRQGLAIPDDLAIAGFGDFDIAGTAVLDLTTVRIFSSRIGREAARMMIAALNVERPAADVLDVGFEIVRRSTT